MKKLKLFPKIFIYTLALLLLITMLASGTIYLLAPMMGENSVLSGGTYVDGMSSAIRTAAIPRNTEIAHTILRSLPYTIAICIVVSLLCAYFFSKAITNPIKGILDATNHMAVLDRKAACKTVTNDEIGILANQINQLYQNLLSTIEHLQEEKDKVSEAEKQKIDFLRSASHELKTPVTALNAMLENMILKVGKYSDYEEYLPLCKERTEQLSKMISEVLDASKLSTTAAEEPQALLYLTVRQLIWAILIPQTLLPKLCRNAWSSKSYWEIYHRKKRIICSTMVPLNNKFLTLAGSR